MAVPSFVDSCRFLPLAGGTANFTYSSVVGGYQSPASAGIVNGNTYSYRAESADLTQWEVGKGTYNTSADVLSRTTVLFNSSGTGTGAGQTGAGSKINFTLVPQVAIVALTEDLNNFLVASNNLSDVGSATTARSNLGLGTAATQNVSAFLQPSNNLSDVSTAATSLNNINGVSYGASQSLTSTDAVGSPSQRTQGRENIYAAPFDSFGWSGIQINGSCDVSQANGTTAVTGAGYVLDGWFANWGGPALSLAQVADAPSGLVNCLKATVTSADASPASVDQAFVQNRIEGYRIARLAFGNASAQPVSVGFWTKHSRTGTYSVTIFNGAAANRSYTTTYTQAAAGVWQFNAVTIPGDTAGTWASDNSHALAVRFYLMAGSGQQGSPGSWGATVLASTGQVNGVASTSDYFQITGLVVLPGIEVPSSTRAPFIMRPFDTEHQLCQRYYSKSFPYATVPANNSAALFCVGQALNTTFWEGQQINYPLPMRTTPTLAFYSSTNGTPTAGNWQLNVGGTWQNGGTASGGSANEKGFSVLMSAATLTAGQCVLGSGNWTADARL